MLCDGAGLEKGLFWFGPLEFRNIGDMMVHFPTDWNAVTIVTPVMDLGAYDPRDVFWSHDSCDQVRRPALKSGGGERGLSGLTRGPAYGAAPACGGSDVISCTPGGNASGEVRIGVSGTEGSAEVTETGGVWSHRDGMSRAQRGEA